LEAIAATRARGIADVIVEKLGAAARGKVETRHFRKKGYPQRTAEVIHNKQEKDHVAAI
jgi:hypothetical protein